MMRPIPVTERLPEKVRVHYDGGADISDSVLAYDEKWGWVIAVYGRVHYGKPVDAWAFDASMISGPEWDAEPLEHVTHWMPELPSPEDAVWKAREGADELIAALQSGDAQLVWMEART